jgi:hypothetical protein
LLQQALDIYRQPLRFRKRWADPGYVLPEGIGELLDLALAPPQALDSHAAALYASRDELDQAIHFFIHQVMLAENNDAYRMLGLPPGAKPAQVKSHYLKLMRLYHPDRHPGNEWSEVYAPRINRAYAYLRRGGTGPVPGHRKYSVSKDFPRQTVQPIISEGIITRQRRKGIPMQIAAWRRRYSLALSGGAVAAGLGFIAWNLWSWPVFTISPNSRPPSSAPQVEFAVVQPPALLDQAGESVLEPAQLISTPQKSARSVAATPSRKNHAMKSATAPTPVTSTGPHQRLEPAGLNESELKAHVLDRLVAAYRQGDLSSLMGLFSERAVTNTQSGWEGIRGEYARLFANSSRRELRLGHFHWQIGDQNAIGRGTFNLKVDAIEQNTQSSYEGTLTMDIGQGPQGPLINGFFQSNRESP